MSVLGDELTGDPLGRGYDAMTAEEAAIDLTTQYRSGPVEAVTGAAILNTTDDAEFDALPDTAKDRWLALCAIDSIDVTSGVAKAIEADLFGPGTATRTSLLAMKTRPISRATELGLPTVKPGHVEEARRNG
jgi:hypothetical protein